MWFKNFDAYCWNSPWKSYTILYPYQQLMALFISFQSDQTINCQFSWFVSLIYYRKKSLYFFYSFLIRLSIFLDVSWLFVFILLRIIFCYHSSFSYWFMNDLSILKILIICHINEDLKHFCCLLSVLFMLLYAIQKFYTNTEVVKTGNSFLYVFLVLVSFLERALLHLNLNIFFIFSSSNFIAFFKKNLIFDPSLINLIRLSIIVSFPND